MSKQIEVLKAIKAHSDAVQNTKPKAVEVPEWDLTLYVWPLTVRDQQVILLSADPENPYEEILTTVMVRAKNADMSPIFTNRDQAKPYLLGEDADLVLRIVKDIQAVDSSMSEVKKSSKTIPISELSSL